MRVSEIFEERSAFSFEVFPPKTDVRRRWSAASLPSLS